MSFDVVSGSRANMVCLKSSGVSSVDGHTVNQ